MSKEMSMEQRIARIEDAEEIKKLKYTYAQILDEGYDPDRVAALLSLMASGPSVVWVELQGEGKTSRSTV